MSSDSGAWSLWLNLERIANDLSGDVAPSSCVIHRRTVRRQSGDVCVGGSESTTSRGGRLRLIRRLAGSTPNKTDTDSSDMVAMIGVVIGLVQAIKIPFVTIA